MRPSILLTVGFLLLLASCATDSSTSTQDGSAHVSHASNGTETRPFHTHVPTDIRWKPGPPSLASGAQIAVLEGDPTKEGPFVFRVKVPDGFLIRPHTHPRAERVTV